MQSRTTYGLISLIFSLSALVSQTPASAEDVVAYGPELSTLTGTLKRATLPGPPDYKSIADGDEPESFYILHVNEPITIQGKAGDEVDVTEKNVADIQLDLGEGHHAKGLKSHCMEFEDRKLRVTVSGTLAHSNTKHHHTALVMTLKDIKPATGK